MTNTTPERPETHARELIPGALVAGIPLPTISDQPDNLTLDFPVSTSTQSLTQAPTHVEPPIVNQPEQSPWELSLADGCRRYSNSEIQTFKRCRRKWYLAYYRRFQPRVESPVGARAIGDRIHRALRWHYEADVTQRVPVLDALELIIASDFDAVRQQHPSGLVPLSLDTQLKKDADLERIMIAGYIEWLAETGADSDYEFTGSEEYLEADLPEFPNVKIIARLDARVRRISDGVRLLLDHKSVANFDMPKRTLRLNEQMLTYILIEMLQRDDDSYVEGALYNMLRRVKRTANAKPPFYERVVQRHNRIEITNFLTRLQGTVAEIERVRAELDADPTAHRKFAFPTPGQDCTWACNFLTIDTLMDDGSHWEAMAAQAFHVGDPSYYYVKGTTI